MEHAIINCDSVLAGWSSRLLGGDTLSGEYRIWFPEDLCTVRS